MGVVTEGHAMVVVEEGVIGWVTEGETGVVMDGLTVVGVEEGVIGWMVDGEMVEGTVGVT